MLQSIHTHKHACACIETAATHTHTQNYSGEGKRLPLSATFHSGLSWQGVPGLRPTTAFKHWVNTTTSAPQSRADRHPTCNPSHTYRHVINGVSALDMTASLSPLLQRATHNLSVSLWLISLCPSLVSSCPRFIRCLWTPVKAFCSGNTTLAKMLRS